MADGQIDKLWSLVLALKDRIDYLEGVTQGLGYRADTADNEIDGLKWRITHE